MSIPRSALLFAAGGDVLAKYGTLVRRQQIPTRGGEDAAEVFTRASVGWSIGATGLLVPAAANVPRLEYITSKPYYLGEAAATNVVLRNRDCANAAWTKTTCTAVRDQVGVDGVANAASSLLATAGNATCLQAITLGSSARFQTVYVKRLVGTGVVQMTMDNGATWTAIAVTANYVRVSIPTQTLANPTVGFRLVTNGDKIAVDFVQNETGTFATSPIETAAAAVTRSADGCSMPFPYQPQAMWIYLKHVERGLSKLTGSGWALLAIPGNQGPCLNIDWTGSAFRCVHDNGVTNVQGIVGSSPNIGDTNEFLALLAGDGSVQAKQSINGAADVVSSPTGALAFAQAWLPGGLTLNGFVSGLRDSAIAHAQVKIGLGPITAVSTIADARAVPV